MLMAGADGDDDVSNGTHGPALLKNFALLAACIHGGNSPQNGLWGSEG
jgi:hypothetical protein